VLCCCWLGSRKGIRPVKAEWWGAGTVICLERGADLHMSQLMPLPLTVSCFSKIQIGSTFLVLAHPGSPGKRAVKSVCVRVVCVCELVSRSHTLKNEYWYCQGEHWKTAYTVGVEAMSSGVQGQGFCLRIRRQGPLKPEYYTTLHPFNGLFSRTALVSSYQKCKTSLDLNEARVLWGLGMAVASAGPYANNVHLAPDR